MEVEALIEKYVIEIGGELVSSLLSKSPPHVNADYLFRKTGSVPIVAELKRLTGDPRPGGLCKKFEVLAEHWIERGMIAPFLGTKRFESQDLPPQAQSELFERLGKRIKKTIHGASDQIRNTKKHFGLHEAKGLLLLVHDGDYSLEPEIVMHLINRSMTGSGSAIDTVIYFTVNMVCKMPGLDRNALIWIEASHVSRPGVNPEFLKLFREKWMIFFSRQVGSVIPVHIVKTPAALAETKFIHPPEPGRYYVNMRGNQFRCMEVAGNSVKWLRFNFPSGGHLLHVVFGQNLRYAEDYLPISDEQEILRLKAIFKGMRAAGHS